MDIYCTILQNISSFVNIIIELFWWTTIRWYGGLSAVRISPLVGFLRSESVAKKMNDELKGVLHISLHHLACHSHMWNSDTLCHYLDFLKFEIHRRRVALGLRFEDRALVLCDAAAVHSTAFYQKIRERFERESNSILIHGGTVISDGSTPTRPTIPGGWGAAGGPNDAFHQCFHFLRRGWMRVATGMASSTKIRKALADLDLSVDGNTRMTLLTSASVSISVQYVTVLKYCIIKLGFPCR